MASKIWRTIRGARPSEGSSNRRRRGRLISARDRQHLLFAAGECAAALVKALPQARKEREHAFKVLAERGRIGDQRAHLEIFQYRHAREDTAAFRRLRQFE